MRGMGGILFFYLLIIIPLLIFQVVVFVNVIKFLQKGKLAFDKYIEENRTSPF